MIKDYLIKFKEQKPIKVNQSEFVQVFWIYEEKETHITDVSEDVNLGIVIENIIFKEAIFTIIADDYDDLQELDAKLCEKKKGDNKDECNVLC